MTTSIFRKTIAGLVLTGGVLAGTAGIAAAETGSTGTPKPTEEQVCERAHLVWDRLVGYDGHLHEHYRTLGAWRDKAVADGNTELAAKLTRRMEWLKNRHDVAVERLRNLHDRVAERCGLDDAPTHPAF